MFGALLAGSAGVAEAAKIAVSEDSFVDVRVLLQTWGTARDAAAADGESLGGDFYLRRGRVLVLGSVSKNVSFFVETDSPNFGKAGDFSPTMFLQDAFASFKLAPEFVLDTGLVIVPLTHHTFQGAVSLNTLDYHAFLVRHPAGSTKVWRDVGVQARGLLFGPRVHYRIGAFGGVRSLGSRTDAATGDPLPDLNPDSVPRAVGHVRFNVFDPEDDFFLSGIYLGKKKVVSFGVGGDYQPKAVAAGAEVSDASSVGADVFVDLPVGADQEFVAQVNAIRYAHGETASTTGLGFFAETGWRWKEVEPVVAYERFWSEADVSDFQGWHVGFNWWINGHNVNLKADLALERDVLAQQAFNFKAAEDRKVATLQTQLYF